MNEIKSLRSDIVFQKSNDLLQVVLYGKKRFACDIKKRMLLVPATLIKDGQEFGQTLS